MDTKQRRLKHKLSAGLVFLMVLIGSVASVRAMNFQLGPGTTLDIDTQLKYDAAWRIEDPDPALDSSGNQNFDQGDMINNKFSTTLDIDFRHKQAGLFLRPRAYYDFAYDDSKFPSATKDLHRDKAEILDAFGYADFKLGGRLAMVRVGWQVINWGESLFIQNNIGSAQNPIDATALTSPDVQLKEVYLPTNQAVAKLELGANFSVEGYYQFEWEKSRIPERGSYWSISDLLDEAGADIVVPGVGVIERTAAQDSDDSGQHGVAVRYLAEALNFTEFGLYYINYHNKSPNIVFVSTGGGPAYTLDYTEDIQLLGASASAAIGDWNLSGEISYRRDVPVAVDNTDPTYLLPFRYDLADVLQAQVSFIRVWSTRALWDQITLTGEVGFNRVYADSDVELYQADEFAMGYVLQLEPQYIHILPGLDLAVPITYAGNPCGDSAIAGTFTERSDSVGIKFNFTYLTVYELGVGYTTFFGGTDNNNFDDRDFVSVTVKYTY